jgi:hypothetical protein
MAAFAAILFGANQVDDLAVRAMEQIMEANRSAEEKDDEYRLAAMALDASDQVRQAWVRRQDRISTEHNLIRAGELQHRIPPGPWDDDLDAYPYGQEFAGNLGNVNDGYSYRLIRNDDWSWNGYIILPDEHICSGKFYDYFNDFNDLEHPLPDNIPRAPTELSYSAGNIFGFDYMHRWDLRPGARFPRVIDLFPPAVPPVYTTFDQALQKLTDLKNYFQDLEAHHRAGIQAAFAVPDGVIPDPPAVPANNNAAEDAGAPAM